MTARLAIMIFCTLFQLVCAPLSAMSAEVPVMRKAFEANIVALANEKQDVRTKAAECLRTTLANGGTAPGDRDEAHWASKLQAIKIGMSKDEVEKLIPPTEEAQPTLGQGMGSYSVKQRLDNNWEATLYFDPSHKVYAVPQLRKSVLSVWVPPAPDFSGTWTTYYVNGQKANEIQYKDGEYNGTHTNFYASGKKTYEQHYVNGVNQGTDQGWHENGQQSYTGQYVNDRQDGLWVWWNPDGTKQNEVMYKLGRKQ